MEDTIPSNVVNMNNAFDCNYSDYGNTNSKGSSKFNFIGTFNASNGNVVTGFNMTERFRDLKVDLLFATINLRFASGQLFDSSTTLNLLNRQDSANPVFYPDYGDL